MNDCTRPGFATEVEFTLPKGYIDARGILHRDGVMRLATAADEILPLRDPRVQANEAYLTVIVLSRVILRLGALTDIDTRTIEGLFASDLDYLQRLYERLNGGEESNEPGEGRRTPGED
jgi:hypothetical protein